MPNQLDLSTLVASIQQISQIIGFNGKSLAAIATALESTANTAPIAASNSGTGTSETATTATFTAPSAGAAVIVAQALFAASASSVVLTSSLSGIMGLISLAAGTQGFAWAYLPMTTGQTTTFTATATAGDSTTISVGVVAFYLPGA